MSGTISFLGLSSDQDMNAYVDALVSLRRDAHIRPLENRVTDYTSKLETIETIDTALSSFYGTVRGMDRTSGFMVRQATSSDETLLTVTASSQAALGSHTVQVNRLAKAETEIHSGVQNDIEYHSGVSDQTAPINNSGSDKTFSYSYDGTTRNLTVTDGDTLVDLQDAINDDTGNPGITATIVAGGGLDHLVLSETTPDGSKAILVDPDAAMTLDGSDSTADFTSAAFTETINASGSEKTLQLQYGSETAVDITVPTGMTLAGLRDLINRTDIDVKASILNDGGSGSGSTHLVLTGEHTGDDYGILLNAGGGGTTTMDGTSLTEDFTDSEFDETVSAQDSRIQVDGFPAGPPWIERSTNRISDVLEGVTFNLIDTGASATVTVSTDKDATIEKIETFVQGFNTIRSAIRDATKYNAKTGTSGTLLGNYAVQIIKIRLDSIVTGGVAGFQDPDDAYSSLQQLGFSTDATQGSHTEGELLLDTAQLSQALDTDPDGVAKLFSAYLDGATDSSQIRFASSLSTASPGIYDVEVDTGTEQGRFRIEGGDWGDWEDLDGASGSYTLTGMTGPERGVAVNIALTAGSGIHSTALRLRTGVAAQLSDELTALLSTSGPLNTLEDNTNDIIENMAARIDDEENRILDYEERLRERFSRLDVYISQMNSLSESISSMVSSFAKNK